MIGGGPAGAAAAISAARSGHEVLLLEQGRLPRHKVCGEFVSPEGAGLLAHLLGAGAPILDSAPRLDQVRFFADGRVVEAKLPSAGRGITRFDLDLALWRAARGAGVECRAGVSVDSVKATDRRFRIATSAGSFEAPLVINASGRWSRLTRPANAVQGGIGLKAHCQERSPPRSVDLYFFPEGYCGVQAIGPDRINVCALVSAAGPRSLEKVWRLSPELEHRASGWTPLWRPIATAPVVLRAPHPLRDGMLCVGDAAGFVDPFVGDGISLALTSGWMAGSLRDAVGYAREYERRLAPVFRAAASLRLLMEGSPGMRRLTLAALGVPAVARLAFRLTRPGASF